MGISKMVVSARYNGKESFEEWKKDWDLEDRYNFKTIENKWQKIWLDEGVYKTETAIEKNGNFILANFLYNDVKLNINDVRFYIGLDVITRQKRMNGGDELDVNNRKTSIYSDDIININEMIDAYGIDAFRIYMMFIGPFNQNVKWSEDSLNGAHKFVGKVFGLFNKITPVTPSRKDLQIMHKTIISINKGIEQLKFNVAISLLMTYVNYLAKLKEIPQICYEVLLKLMSPFAPHLADEMWARLGYNTLIMNENWPSGDTELAKENSATIAVQINGKVRGIIEVERDLDNDKVVEIAKSLDNIAEKLTKIKPKKVIVIPNRIVNIVV